jgi:peptidyl-prolyl cis-trans isomerase D
VQASNDAAGFGAPKVITRGKADGVAPMAVSTVMGAPATKLPMVIGVDLADGGYGLYRINKVSQPEKSDPALRDAIKGTLARTQSEADFNAYLVALKASAKVVLHPENIEKKPN